MKLELLNNQDLDLAIIKLQNIRSNIKNIVSQVHNMQKQSRFGAVGLKFIDKELQDLKSMMEICNNLLEPLIKEQTKRLKEMIGLDFSNVDVNKIAEKIDKKIQIKLKSMQSNKPKKLKKV